MIISNKKFLSAVAFVTAATSLCINAGIMPQNMTAFADDSDNIYYTRDPFYNFSSQYNYYTSDHFQFIWGNGGTSSAVTAEFLKGNAENLENCWKVYTDELGMDTPSQSVDKSRRDGKHYKINIYISGTGLSGMTDDWAYMSYDVEQYPYLFVCTDAMQYNPPSWVLPHELGHAFTAAQLGWNNNKYSQGWWEAMGNWFREQYLYSDYSNDNTGHGTDFFETYIKNLSLTFPCGRDYYAAWPFLQYLTENPDNMQGYGKTFVKTMLQEGKKDEYPFDMVARLSGADIKETFGNFAKRMATIDFEQKDAYNARLNELLSQGDWNYNEIYTYLEKRDDSDWYYVPTERAPQHAGINIIPLEITGDKISATLEGTTNAKGADWRACIVAEDTDGKTYYSDLFKSGETQTLNINNKNITKAYLTVVATPDNNSYQKPGLPYGPDSEFSESKLGFREKQQYPYKVKFTGADIHYNKINTDGIPGHAHANGGGFVADTATVDDSVYVAPNAKVLGYASVTGNARIEDNAVVEGSAKVSGNAIIKDYAMIAENGTVQGNAIVADTAQVMGNAVISDNARVLESAVVYGNYKISDNAQAKGMAFCMANGSLSGQATVDGDWYDDGNKTSSKGTSYGWVSDQNYVNNRPFTDGLTYGYDFDEDSTHMFDDKYNSTYGISVNNPKWEETRTGANGVITYNGKDNYSIIDNEVAENAAEIDVKALYRGGDNNQKIFSINGNEGITLTPANDNNLPELAFGNKKITGTKAIEKGVWYDYDIKIKFDSVTLKITSKNGTDEEKITGTFDLKNILKSNNKYNYIGRGENGEYFNGSVDSFDIYNKDVNLNYTPITEKEDIEDNTDNPNNYPEGDVNHDNKTDKKDLDDLQKFIIKINLKAPENGDLTHDGKIDVFDLVYLKRLLQYNS